MDSEIIYSLVGIVIFIIIIIVVLRSDVSDVDMIKTKSQKREEIVSGYKTQLKDALKDLTDNKEARVAKKSSLLKEFSDELSRNIFFDKDEIKDIILNLSQE